MESYKNLLLANKAWVAEKLQLERDYFINLSKDQKPEFLWIGCSDSRVPAEVVTGTHPGDLFVHRNIANLVLNNDLNTQCVIHYAVEFLKVKHVIVCGHYGCGGVKASLTNKSFDIMDRWLCNIKDIYQNNEKEFTEKMTEDQRVDRLVELSVLSQVENIRKTPVVQKAWANHQAPTIHGWVFNMKDGLLKSLCKVDPTTPMAPIFKFSKDELLRK